MNTNTSLLTCGHPPSLHGELTNGYGINQKGETSCYDCIAVQDKATMINDGHSKALPLYWDGKMITNWPGSLKFSPLEVRKSRHNMGGNRTDIWFMGPDQSRWHGFQIGQFTQIAHCKRMKKGRS